MEININCDLGEKSKYHSNHNDPKLLDIVNSANVACGYHAGDDHSMNEVVEISKKNEPFETLVIDVPEEHSGKAIELVTQRKGELLIMEPKGDLQHLEFIMQIFIDESKRVNLY